MNLSKILILVTSVTLLSACGGKSGGGQPTMKKSTNNKSKVTVTEEGQVTFQSEQCEAINVESVKEFCEVAVTRIKADDACKEELALGFKANSCESQVDASEIADYLATVNVDEDGKSTSEEVTVVEVNPEDKGPTITGDSFSVVSVDMNNDQQVDAPVATSAAVQDAIDRANDAAAEPRVVADDVDVAHVVFIPDLSNNNAQVQVQSVPAVQVSNVENVETKTIETRIEEINDTEVQHISQRDHSMTVEEQAKAKCKDLYKQINERPTRRQMRKCVRSVEVVKVQ